MRTQNGTSNHSTPRAKIGLDACLWDEPTTGIGLYTHCLADGLSKLGVDVRLFGARSSGDFPRGSTSRTKFVLWQLGNALESLGCELFHAVANFDLPLTRSGRTRFVLTVHDLIPLVLPSTVSRAYRWQFRLWLTRSLQVADRVICVSEHTRSDLLQRFDFDRRKTSVIHNGADHVKLAPNSDESRRRFIDLLNLPPRFILYGGALDARKNIETLLQACRRLRSFGRTVALVLAGQPWFGAKKLEFEIKAARDEGVGVRLLGHQSESVFYELMRRATVFVYPSLYEGFGLPALEAMAIGCPAIVSNRGSLPEVCGPAADYVDPTDEQALANAMDAVFNLSDDARERRIAEGKSWSSRFSWDETARKTLEVYTDTLANS